MAMPRVSRNETPPPAAPVITEPEPPLPVPTMLPAPPVPVATALPAPPVPVPVGDDPPEPELVVTLPIVPVQPPPSSAAAKKTILRRSLFMAHTSDRLGWVGARSRLQRVCCKCSSARAANGSLLLERARNEKRQE